MDLDFVNESDALKIIMEKNNKLARYKKELDVFMESHEGNMKLSTNTQQEESAVKYWEGVLQKKQLDCDKSLGFYKLSLEQTSNKYEKTAEKAKQDYDRAMEKAKQDYDRIVEKAKQEYDRISQYTTTQYEKTINQAKQEHDKSSQYTTGQMNYMEGTYKAEMLNLTDKLNTAKQKLALKIAKKKPKKQLEIEKNILEEQNSINYWNNRIESARKKGMLV